MTDARDPARGWRAYHLVYHEDRDRLLRELVLPLAASLAAEGELAGFFFIRYNLGGPHVRLRLLPADGRDAAVEGAVRAAAAAFFARAPSLRTLPDETVRMRNREVIPGDPFATAADDAVLPDNSIHAAPPAFEVERYGGAERFAPSLDAFALSSVDALAWLAQSGAPTAAARLGEAWSASVRHAWFAARDPDEFLRLLAAPVPSSESPLATFAARADDAYARGAAGMQARIRDELARLASATVDGVDASRWTAGPRRLLPVMAEADDATRLRLAHSHAHMTCNRIGLLVAEEAYLGRMLWRAARDVADVSPDLWADAWAARRAQWQAPPPPVAHLLPDALARLGEVSPTTADLSS
ncbi:MAG TPA: lantibiotic dehydratase C-terminal domain-containing protein [Longimicrobium sp.]